MGYPRFWVKQDYAYVVTLENYVESLHKSTYIDSYSLLEGGHTFTTPMEKLALYISHLPYGCYILSDMRSSGPKLDHSHADPIRSDLRKKRFVRILFFIWRASASRRSSQNCNKTPLDHAPQAQKVMTCSDGAPRSWGPPIAPTLVASSTCASRSLRTTLSSPRASSSRPR